MPPENIKRFLYFVEERYNIYLKRQAGLSKPWTEDLILQKYKFTNCYRELDRVTIWIKENWREPNNRDPHLWFAMCVARLINWPPTLQTIGYPVPWYPARFLRIMRGLEGKKYTGVYMVRGGKVKGEDKAQYLVEEVFNPLWENRHKLRPYGDDTLQSFYDKLVLQSGFGSFMAGQVVADMKYAPVFQGCDDWWHFAVPGPGSKRGLNRVLGYDIKAPWKSNDWIRLLELLERDWIHDFLRGSTRLKMPNMHLQDLQNCLCEFDKYERVRLGEGVPRNRYNGGIE